MVRFEKWSIEWKNKGEIFVYMVIDENENVFINSINFLGMYKSKIK